jgi:lysophospholipase L1-like esterase
MSSRLLSEIKNHIKKSKIYRIAFYGDSITSTEWVHPNFREIIEYVLKDYLTDLMHNWQIPSWNIRCFNAALDGGTSKDMLQNLKDYILIHKPNLVILQGTRNDFSFKLGVPKHIKNITSIIKKLLANKIDVIFCGTTPSLLKRTNKEYSPFIKQDPIIAKKLKIKYVDLFHKYQKFNLKKFFTFISEGDPDAGLKVGELDKEHPNTLGNAYIAKILLKDIFGIKFDPELYIKEVLAGKKYPKYCKTD